VPDLFQDLGFGSLTVPALPIPHQIAERLHAITRLSKAGTPRTPVGKDLADLVMISVTERPTSEDMRTAIEAVFRAYNTHVLPVSMPTTPAEWARDYHDAAEALGIPTELEMADVMAGELLSPVLWGAAQGVWSPTQRRWSSGGAHPAPK